MSDPHNGFRKWINIEVDLFFCALEGFGKATRLPFSKSAGLNSSGTVWCITSKRFSPRVTSFLTGSYMNQRQLSCSSIG